jgi:hypothetical protein
MGRRYHIHHIAGFENVWADSLSRWGSSLERICAIKVEGMIKSPQIDETFAWPTSGEILLAQKTARLEGTINEEGLVVNESGKVIIPGSLDELKLRICVIAHGGAAGHQDEKNTMDAVEAHFW